MHERLLNSTRREDQAKDAISWIRCTVDSAIVSIMQIISVILVHLANERDCTDVPLRLWFKIFAVFHGLDMFNQWLVTSVKFKGIQSSLMYLSYALIHFTGYLIWVVVGIVWFWTSEGCAKCKIHVAFQVGHTLMGIYVVILLLLFSLTTFWCMHSILTRCFKEKI